MDLFLGVFRDSPNKLIKLMGLIVLMIALFGLSVYGLKGYLVYSQFPISKDDLEHSVINEFWEGDAQRENVGHWYISFFQPFYIEYLKKYKNEYPYKTYRKFSSTYSGAVEDVNAEYNERRKNYNFSSLYITDKEIRALLEKAKAGEKELLNKKILKETKKIKIQSLCIFSVLLLIFLVLWTIYYAWRNTPFLYNSVLSRFIDTKGVHKPDVEKRTSKKQPRKLSSLETYEQQKRLEKAKRGVDRKIWAEEKVEIAFVGFDTEASIKQEYQRRRSEIMKGRRLSQLNKTELQGLENLEDMQDQALDNL
jgi:hypothetical protein